MANSAPVLIWIADNTKSRIWFNKAWHEFTGHTHEEEVGFGWTQNVHEDDLAKCLQAYGEGFDARKPFRAEYRIRQPDGQARWITEQATPLFEGPSGGFSGFIGSCIDITELKKLQAEREETLKTERSAREEAERVGRLKDEFLATVSHELRTPLNAILGWSTLLRRLQPGSQDYGRGLETIERNARVQAQIIGDLLDMSRIISGKVQLDVQPIDLAEVINAAIDAVKPSIEATQAAAAGHAGCARGPPARRSRSTAAGDLEPAHECGEVHAARRTHRRDARARELARGVVGRGFRHRHQTRIPGLRVRPVQPGGFFQHASSWRPRPGPLHRQAPGRVARWFGAGEKSRRRAGRNVHRRVADLGDPQRGHRAAKNGRRSATSMSPASNCPA